MRIRKISEPVKRAIPECELTGLLPEAVGFTERGAQRLKQQEIFIELNRRAVPLALIRINVFYLPRPDGRGYFLASLRDSHPEEKCVETN
jgi:hypothetical protein